MSAKQKNKSEAKEAVTLQWTKKAWSDYVYWQEADDKTLNSINGLIEECLLNPFKGKGKPEPLKGNLTGYWSRRITREHRLVYLPDGNSIYIIACRFHYE